MTLLSCDNLQANGDTLRSLVLAFALRLDVALTSWIDTHCTFPNSMVDRIVPATRDDDRARIAQRLGVEDAWPVIGEPYMNWVVEDKFAAGRPAWEAAGATFVANAAPYERLKLRMVNGPHSVLAYLGTLLGAATMREAAAVPALRGFVDDLMRHEIAPTLKGIPDAGLEGYRQRFLARVDNAALPHPTRQVAMDGSQKLPPRLLATIRDRLRGGDDIRRLALAVAAWLHYLRGEDEHGARYPIEDPLAAPLSRLLARRCGGAGGCAQAGRVSPRPGAGGLSAGVRRPGRQARVRQRASRAAGNPARTRGAACAGSGGARPRAFRSGRCRASGRDGRGRWRRGRATLAGSGRRRHMSRRRDGPGRRATRPGIAAGALRRR